MSNSGGADADDLDGRVAVIGMAGRFPGAPDLDTFWANLRDGVESIRTLDEAELLAAGERAEVFNDPAYVPAGAPLEGIDQFDATFFGMSPRDAAVFDPQHRLFLECAWEAFEDAGYVGSGIDGAVGVFATCGLSEYMFKNVLANAEIASSVGEWLVRHTGNDTNFLATRVSYELNLTGPSLNVQTACSSSLVAIHLACQSLLNGECDMALAGGSVVLPQQHKGYLYREGEILSPDGHCRAFDEKASGTVLSSATGCVLLKRLSAALDDGDNVLAVVLGSAINNDGRAKVGFLAPSVDGQSAVISEALAVAGVDARDVTYVEAHGTGTLIGDPIEVAALTKAYRHDTSDTQFCAIGSLKSNVGHAGEASGVAGFIKTVLALQHRAIPASLHFQSPNPQADLPDTPFFVNAELRQWQPGPSGRRIAGITNLGAGGTNAHLLIAEAPPVAPPEPAARSEQLVVVSARTDEALSVAVGELASHLRANPHLPLADVAYTRLAGRRQFPARCAVVASTAEDAAAALEGSDPRSIVRQHRRGPAPAVAFLAPGGGAQYVGMGRDLYEAEPVYRRVVDECAEVLRRRWGLDLIGAVYPPGPVDDAAARALERPSIALPALFTVSIAMAALLESWGITPDAMIGHSAGEYVAAYLAGVFSRDDALSLVAERGRLFETVAPGAMLSVSRGEDDVRSWLPDGLDVGVVNTREQCVISGPTDAIARFEQLLVADGIDCTRVHIDVAAHSSMLEPILDEFESFCRALRYGQPKVPWVSNVSGDWISAAEATDPMYWVAHLRRTVRFHEGIERLLIDSDRVLVEIGPGRTLVGFAQAATGKSVASTPTLRHPKDTVADVTVALRAAGRVWASGVDVDADALCGPGRRRIALPTYPFERSRHWVDPDPVDRRSFPRRGLVKLEHLDDWFSVPAWRRSLPPPPPKSRVCQRWLLFGDGEGLADSLAEELRNEGHIVQTVRAGSKFKRAATDEFVLVPSERDQWQQLVDIQRSEGGLPQRIVHLESLGNPTPWLRDATAAYTDTYEQSYLGLLALADVLSAQAAPFHLAIVTSGVHSVTGDESIRPERALLHGAARVIPHELVNVRTTSIDVEVGRSPVPIWGRRARLARLLVRELDEPTDDEVAYRDGRRWVRGFDQVPIRAVGGPTWDRAVVLITGGLGGIGLRLAEHIAEHARDAVLILVGRHGLPPESSWADPGVRAGDDATTRRRIEAVRRMRAAGATVEVVAADVTDRAAVRERLLPVVDRCRRIDIVVHAAGVLNDALIALRDPDQAASVVHAKARSALVLADELARRRPRRWVLFSSVSSILGLPGQADYSAANAFLDAFAARLVHEGESAIAINWNAWQEFGMAVEAAKLPAPPPRRRPNAVDERRRLLDDVDDEGSVVIGTAVLSRADSWLVAEHVVHGGDAVVPGTGHVELIRELMVVAGRSHGPIELRNVAFLAPFVVRPDEQRMLRVRFDRDGDLAMVYAENDQEPNATAEVAPTVAPAPMPLDIARIRARCTEHVERLDGYLPQPFMDFGPRWGVLREIALGRGEALVTTAVPAEFRHELDEMWLHPALLDMATGMAHDLVPRSGPDPAFFVPLSYGRISSYRPLPADALSHIRLRSGASEDVAVFDVTICAPDGSVVVDIEDYTMRRVTGMFTINAATSTVPDRASAFGLGAPVTDALRAGMTPVEGLDAFDRIMAHDLGWQVVASSVDLHEWARQVAEQARPVELDRDTPTGYGRPQLTATFEAPATPIEVELARTWSELLGVDHVGRHDDFFEFGGQSLIAMRLFAWIRMHYQVEMPLATLFEAPTIAQCATVIAAQLGVTELPLVDAADDGSPAEPVRADLTAVGAGTALMPQPLQARSLVQIASAGRGQPFFIVHGAGGNILFLWGLARALAGDRPIYGFQAMGVNVADPPDQSVEEMAARYVQELVASHDGPYLLGGYSGGGVITLEMARQLQAQGHEVTHVVLFDSVPTNRSEWPTVTTRLSHLAVNVRDRGPSAITVKTVFGVHGYKLRAVRKALSGARARAADERGEVANYSLGFAGVEGFVNLFKPMSEVFSRYELTEYDVDITVYQAREIAGLHRPDYYWSEYIRGSITTDVVEGDHHSMFHPQYIPDLASKVRRRLAEVADDPR